MRNTWTHSIESVENVLYVPCTYTHTDARARTNTVVCSSQNRSPISCHNYCCSLALGKIAFIYFYKCIETTHISHNLVINSCFELHFGFSKTKYELHSNSELSLVCEYIICSEDFLV